MTNCVRENEFFTLYYSFRRFGHILVRLRDFLDIIYHPLCKNANICSFFFHLYFYTHINCVINIKTAFDFRAYIRFPRADREPPQLRLRGITFPASPTGQGMLRQRYILRKKCDSIFEESSICAEINR